MPSASLGHDASLSFVVRGRGQHKDRGRRSEVRDQKAEERRKGFSCGSGFPRPELVEGQPRTFGLKGFNDFYDFNAFYGFYGLPFTIYRLRIAQLTI